MENQPTVSYRFINPYGEEYGELRQTLKVGGTLMEPAAPSEESREFAFWQPVNDPSDETVVYETVREEVEDPNIPDSQKTYRFTGWGEITQIEASVGERYPVIKYLKAVFKKQNPQIRVTWYDQSKRIIQTRLLERGVDEIDPEEISYTAKQVNLGEYLVFRYWTQDPTVSEDENGNPLLPVRFQKMRVGQDTMDIQLYPYCAQYHWIYFNGNASDQEGDTSRPGSVPYTAPLLVEPGVAPTAARIPTQPEGYLFTGWYTDKTDQGEMVFDAQGNAAGGQFTPEKLYRGGSSLGYDLTLYAHWEPNIFAGFTIAVYKQRAGDVYQESNPDYHFDFSEIVFDSKNPGEGQEALLALAHTFSGETQTGSKSYLRLKTDDAGAQVTYTRDGTNYESAYPIDLNTLLSGDDLLGFELDTERCQDVEVKPDGSSVFRIYLRRKTYTLHFMDYQLQGASNIQTRHIPDTYFTQTFKDKFPEVKTVVALYGQNIGSEFPISTAASKGYFVNTRGKFSTGASKAVMTGNSWVDADGSSLGSPEDPTYSKRINYVPAFKEGRREEYFVHNQINAESHNLVYYLEMLEPSGNEPTGNASLGGESFRYKDISYYRFDKLNYGGGGINQANFTNYNLDGFTQNLALTREHGRTTAPSVINWSRMGSTADVYCFYTRDSYEVTLKSVLNGAVVETKRLSVPFETPIYETLAEKNGDTGRTGNGVSLILEEYFQVASTEELHESGIWWYNDEGCNDAYDFNGAQVPNHDIVLYKGMKTKAPIQVDPDGGVLDGTNGSTWFRVDNGELISEYTLSREFVTAREANADVANLSSIYKYVYHPYETRNSGGKGVRTAVYKLLTFSEMQSLVSNAGDGDETNDGTFTIDESDEDAPYYKKDGSGNGIAFVYSPGVYEFQYWYQVTGASFVTDAAHPKGYFDVSRVSAESERRDSLKAYNFDIPAGGPTLLKAKWSDAASYHILYQGEIGNGELVEAPVDGNIYADGSQAVILPSVDHPTGKIFRFWAVDPQYDGNGTKRMETGEYTGRKYIPNTTYLTLSRDVIRDGDFGAERRVTLYAWYDSGGATGEASTYSFYVQERENPDAPDSPLIWRDGAEDIPYYVQIISPGEELILPDTPPDPLGADGSRTFVGWFTDKQELQSRFDGFGVISQPQNLKLYARFARTYTVTFKDRPLGSNGQPQVDGEGRELARTVTERVYLEGEQLDTTGISPVVEDGTYVNNWTTDGTDYYPYEKKGKYFGTDVQTQITANLILYPVIANIYTLRFDSQGGSYVEPVTFPKDLNQWALAPEAPTRRGYRFMGWWTQEGYSGITGDGSNPRTDEGRQYLFDKPLAETATSFAVTENGGVVPEILYAHWERTGEAIPAKIKVNYWVQNTERKDYILYASKDYAEDENGDPYVADTAHKLNDAELSLTNMAGYYTFPDDQKNGLADDQSQGYFEYSTSEVESDCIPQTGKTFVGEKTIREDGTTEYDVYFNRVIFKLGV